MAEPRQYQVRWEIDIEADTPQEAAEEALHIQRDADSIATVFDAPTLRPERRPTWTSIPETSSRRCSQ